MNKGTKIALIIAGISLVIAFVAVFFIANNFFMGRFPDQQTIVGGTEVSGKTVPEAVVAMNSAEGLKLNISKGGQNYEIPLSGTVTRMFNGEQVEKAKSDISFFKYLFHETVDMPLKPESVSVKEDELKKTIKKALPNQKYKTSDAYFDSDWNLIAEVQGDDVNYSEFLKKIVSDIENGAALNYNVEDFFYHPKVRAEDEDMKKIQDKVSKYKAMSVTYTFGSKIKEVITSEKICSNLVLKKNKLKLKTGWIKKYIRRLASKYNTFGSKRKFKSTKDGINEVPGGTFGWWMDEEATVKKLKSVLKKLKPATLEPVYKIKGVAFGKLNDIGKSYVEVSISRQHVWVYIKGELKLETDCVTGVPNKERMTHPGCHRIIAKQKDRYLGTMAVQGYHTHVDYFMPFNGGEGLHDAPWRSSFGGKIYKTGGSHGCVNLPPAMAAKMFDIVYVGMPVIVYN